MPDLTFPVNFGTKIEQDNRPAAAATCSTLKQQVVLKLVPIKSTDTGRRTARPGKLLASDEKRSRITSNNNYDVRDTIHEMYIMRAAVGDSSKTRQLRWGRPGGALPRELNHVHRQGEAAREGRM